MALLLLSGGTLAQHSRRGAAPGLPASTQDHAGQTYASPPQATQPLLLPPIAAALPASSIRRTTWRLSRHAAEGDGAGVTPGAAAGLCAGAAARRCASFCDPARSAPRRPRRPSARRRALEQLVPELLRRLGSLQGAPPSLGRMLQATALARLQPPATAPRNGVDLGVRRAALPALLDQMPLGADAKARLRAAEPAAYAPAPRPPPSFRRPAAATPEPEVLGLLRGDGRDARRCARIWARSSRAAPARRASASSPRRPTRCAASRRRRGSSRRSRAAAGAAARGRQRLRPGGARAQPARAAARGAAGARAGRRAAAADGGGGLAARAEDALAGGTGLAAA